MKTLYRSDRHWNQYRIQSNRASWWDYGKNGRYYVTICTKHRFPFFGQIKDHQFKSSKIGELVRQLWLTLPEMSLPGVQVEALAISPNHLHGIIVLERPKDLEPVQEKEHQIVGSPKSEDEAERKAFFQSISPKKGSLAHLIRKFKGLVTKAAREQGWLGKKEPLWQAGYYDRIIRNTDELNRIVEHLSSEVHYWEAREDDYYVHQPASQPTKQRQHRLQKVLKTLYKQHKTTADVMSSQWPYSIYYSRRKFQEQLTHWLKYRFPNIYAPIGNGVVPIWKLSG